MNRIFHEAITCQSEKELGNVCLSVAEELTDSTIGFIGEVHSDGQLYDIAISNPGWELCDIDDKIGHRKTPGTFKISGLYGHILEHGRSLLTNDPASHSDSIGLPKGHPPLTAFLGVPLIDHGKTIGLIAVGNREGGYSIDEQQILQTLAPAVVQALLRKRAEEALSQSEARFRLALKNAPVSVAVQDRNLVYQWAYNQKTRRTDEILGKTDADLFCPEDVAAIREVKLKVLESGKEARVQHWLTSNGRKLFLTSIMNRSGTLPVRLRESVLPWWILQNGNWRRMRFS